MSNLYIARLEDGSEEELDFETIHSVFSISDDAVDPLLKHRYFINYKDQDQPLPFFPASKEEWDKLEAAYLEYRITPKYPS